MGRISDVVGIPSPSKTFFAAAAAGGIWKSTNNGVTWRPVFDNQRVISMGMLAIAPSDTMQVWAGTGEPNSRNTISPGGGVYKSTDGGITWKLTGLEKTQAIGRIVVHPTNPNIVYVAALGAPWSANPERGLYKTEDGGTTWQTQSTGVSVSLVAGSSPSATVCWLVGPAGTVVVTGDGGRSWQRIAFPAAVDLRSVRATDDKTATVVTADSRQFSTSDGGATWHPR